MCVTCRLPSHLHAKLKSMQEKLIKAMATRQKGGLEGEEGEPADLLSSLPQDAMLQVGRGGTKTGGWIWCNGS